MALLGQREQRRNGEDGFSLMEVLLALVVIVIGVMAVASMMVLAIRLQVLSRDTTLAIGLAEVKLEELRYMDPADPERTLGGDLNSNVVDHFENANGNLFTVRWKIDPGPINTQDITIGVVTNALNPQISTVRLQALLQ